MPALSRSGRPKGRSLQPESCATFAAVAAAALQTQAQASQQVEALQGAEQGMQQVREQLTADLRQQQQEVQQLLAQHSAEVARDTIQQFKADQVRGTADALPAAVVQQTSCARAQTQRMAAACTTDPPAARPAHMLTDCSSCRAAERHPLLLVRVQEVAQGGAEAAARVVSLESKLKVVVAEVDRIQEQASLTARLQVRSSVRHSCCHVYLLNSCRVRHTLHRPLLLHCRTRPAT